LATDPELLARAVAAAGERLELARVAPTIEAGEVSAIYRAAA
jgi:hypothetical protein